MTETGPVAIGVDVGGSGIKAAAVDTSRGVLVSERVRVPTPEPSNPAAVIASIFRIVRRVEHSIGANGLPIGVDFPSVILGGMTMTAANVDRQWVQYPAEEHLERALGRPVALVNDADAAGLAEMRFGAGAGHRGVVLVLTLGTGVGSALFVDGLLVPNTELGHMEIRGRDAERRSAAAARVRRGLSWKAWTEDLDEHLIAIDRILWPDLIVLGGGVSKNADRFIPRLTCRPPVVPAVLRNEAGMVGAAMVALERLGASGSWDPSMIGGSGRIEGESPMAGEVPAAGEAPADEAWAAAAERDAEGAAEAEAAEAEGEAEAQAESDAEGELLETAVEPDGPEAAADADGEPGAAPVAGEASWAPEPGIGWPPADGERTAGGAQAADSRDDLENDEGQVESEPVADVEAVGDTVVVEGAEVVEDAEVVELPDDAETVVEGEAIERPIDDEGGSEEAGTTGG